MWHVDAPYSDQETPAQQKNKYTLVLRCGLHDPFSSSSSVVSIVRQVRAKAVGQLRSVPGPSRAPSRDHAPAPCRRLLRRQTGPSVPGCKTS